MRVRCRRSRMKPQIAPSAADAERFALSPDSHTSFSPDVVSPISPTVQPRFGAAEVASSTRGFQFEEPHEIRDETPRPGETERPTLSPLLDPDRELDFVAPWTVSADRGNEEVAIRTEIRAAKWLALENASQRLRRVVSDPELERVRPKIEDNLHHAEPMTFSFDEPKNLRKAFVVVPHGRSRRSNARVQRRAARRAACVFPASGVTRECVR